jgi:hypothetical protein
LQGGFAPFDGKDAGTLKKLRQLAIRSGRCPKEFTDSNAGGDAMPRRSPLLVCLTLFVFVFLAVGQAPAEVKLPTLGDSSEIVVRAEKAERWQQGTEQIWRLLGKFELVQDGQRITGDEAIVWVDPNPPTPGQTDLVVYVEGNVTYKKGGKSAVRVTDETWLSRHSSNGGVHFKVPQVAGVPKVKPTILDRALAHRNPDNSGAIRRTQYTQYDVLPTPVAEEDRLVPGQRRVRFFPRSNSPVEMKSTRVEGTNQITCVISSGINLIIDGLPGYGAIDLSTDRLVVWTEASGASDFGSETRQTETIPLELYMEGNIVFRQGDREIRAERMYYDVRTQVGRILDADMLTPVASYEGKMRLRASMIQQNGPSHFFAEDGYLTSSRMGHPGYRLQLGSIEFEDHQQPIFNPISGEPLIDPATGQPVTNHQQRVTGKNGVLFLEAMPVFYWPWLSADVEDPTFYIRQFSIKNDSIFGTQVLTNWDGYEIFGVDNPAVGTDWDLTVDYLSMRGLGHGTTFGYDRNDFFYFPGQSAGLTDFWGIKDHGFDNLGRGQRHLALEKEYRYRWFWQHRQRLPYDLELSAELGWISDRNFLEQYYEREWDELKDETTGAILRQRTDNRSWSANADTRANSFFTQTEWYPRLDHFWIGQDLANETFTWFEHSSATYARYRIASEPEDPAQQAVFHTLPWEVTSKGERLFTTHEFDYPFQLGPVKVVPYGLGQFAHWGEDLGGDSLDRTYWQAGARASMPMWRVDPMVENRLLNVHGLAHKVVFDAEFSAAEADQSVDLLPLYDPLDDDSIENFRRRMAFLTFGTNTNPIMPRYPARFDPRYYAIRYGLPGNVTTPSAEVYDDMMAMRLGMRHRWQTKRGMPGNRRIIDWITFDTNATLFPRADRDNFGSSVGLIDYMFRWHLGDRLTLVSDGIFDTFDEGQKIMTIGGFLSRPPRGNAYMGLRIMDGPIQSQILTMSYNYRMSPKWVSSFGTSFDMGEAGNIGQRLAITRIGESLLVSVGMNVDASKGDVGVLLSIEPRFLPKNRLGQAGGVRIPVAGAYGLE